MFVFPKRYHVIVVGGGHAGVEAALAAARIGCETLLLSMNLDTIGQMSCNPAIGGLAKGHLAREIDALGGEMGMNTDLTGLQFRMLNTKKGPAVWAPRAQCDKKAYQFRLKHVCEREQRLDCKQGQTTKLMVGDSGIEGVETALGVQYIGKSVVLTTGTFLMGLMHVGLEKSAGGRSGESAAVGLSTSLRQQGIELGRLKTGTPPRLQRRTLDFSKMEQQPGDEPVPYFTFWKESLFHVEHDLDDPGYTSSVDRLFHVEHHGLGDKARETSTDGHYPRGSILAAQGGQIPCYITWTTDDTAKLIRANLHKSPLYSGIIEGIGPRYCPSIEDKVVRFADKERHQIFLEPEGLTTEEMYVNGFSTSLPYEVQVELVRTIIGCENAEIMRPAYAVEYDFAFPTQLKPTLESKLVPGLFFAGQINGTSGYEEAGGQGIVAGINAARYAQGKAPITIGRDQAYIGVLIDDLVTKGTSEPYRMFTSRAEYRLLLRQDNADQRLSELGHTVGLLPAARFERVRIKQQLIDEELDRLSRTKCDGQSLLQLLRRPETNYRDLPGANLHLAQEVTEQIEFAAKYAGYVERQIAEVGRFQEMESKPIPRWIDYAAIPGLKTESRQKLGKIMPETIGQASRISGVSPADIGLILVWIKRGQGASSEIRQAGGSPAK